MMWLWFIRTHWAMMILVSCFSVLLWTTKRTLLCDEASIQEEIKYFCRTSTLYLSCCTDQKSHVIMLQRQSSSVWYLSVRVVCCVLPSEGIIRQRIRMNYGKRINPMVQSSSFHRLWLRSIQQWFFENRYDHYFFWAYPRLLAGMLYSYQGQCVCIYHALINASMSLLLCSPDVGLHHEWLCDEGEWPAEPANKSIYLGSRFSLSFKEIFPIGTHSL